MYGNKKRRICNLIVGLKELIAGTQEFTATEISIIDHPLQDNLVYHSLTGHANTSCTSLSYQVQIQPIFFTFQTMFCIYRLRLTMSNRTYLHCICAVELSSNFASITSFRISFFLRVKPYIKAPYMHLFIFQQNEVNLTLLLVTRAGKIQSFILPTWEYP